MNTSTTYEIVIKGRASVHVLRPLLDDFAIDHGTEGVTRLTGDVRDGAHLHGIVAHLSAVNAELISIGPRTATSTNSIAHPTTTNETTDHS